MNKWRRQHKQWLQRRLIRHRLIRAFLRRSMMYAAAASGAARIHQIKATPAARFEGGLIGKSSVVIQAGIDTYKAIVAAHDSIR